MPSTTYLELKSVPLSGSHGIVLFDCSHWPFLECNSLFTVVLVYRGMLIVQSELLLVKSRNLHIASLAMYLASADNRDTGWLSFFNYFYAKLTV